MWGQGFTMSLLRSVVIRDCPSEPHLLIIQEWQCTVSLVPPAAKSLSLVAEKWRCAAAQEALGAVSKKYCGQEITVWGGQSQFPPIRDNDLILRGFIMRLAKPL